MLAVVLILTQQRQDMGTLLRLAVCIMVMGVAMAYLKPVLDLVDTLKDLGGLDGTLLVVLMKAVGIGLVTEMTVLVCNDSGNTALGKVLQLLGTVVILWLSVPLFTALLDLIQEILAI